MATDFGKQIFDLGVSLARTQAEMIRTARQAAPVYCLWYGEILLGICGTRERADTEAEELGRCLNTVIRVERREVHS